MARTPVPGQTGDEGDGLPGDARHAGLRGGRGAHGQVRHPRHGHGPAGVSTTCRCPRRTSSASSARGCKVALTVLDFGRTTFGRSCTGAAKTCLQPAVAHAKTRVQFEQPLASSSWSRRSWPTWPPTPSPWRRPRTSDRVAHRPRRSMTTCSKRPCSRSSSTDALWTDRQRHLPDLRRQGLLHRRAATNA